MGHNEKLENPSAMDKHWNLSDFATNITENFTGFGRAHPKVAEAAEAVNQSFCTMLYEHFRWDVNKVSMDLAHLMGFGSHSGWVMAYVLTASGYIDSGLADLRRAIEFTCYAAKISTNEQRALDWMDQRSDMEARKRFIRSCIIPLSYKSPKYNFLRSLLVAYDYANYFGAHGNFESLVHKYPRVEKENIKFIYQAEREFVPRAVGMTALLGYRLLEALKKILSPCLVETDKLERIIIFTKEALQNARLESALKNFGGNVPVNIFQGILTDDQEEVNRLFDELISREQKRGKAIN